MSKVDNEVKIAEKLKFWEEQDQINKELIPRVVKNHEMITDLTYQFEKKLTSIAMLKSNLDQFQEEVDSLKRLNSVVESRIYSLHNEMNKTDTLHSLVHEQGKITQDLQSELTKFQKELENLKRKSVMEKSNKNLLIYIGVLCVIILSIIGIIL